jgi:hypothetical protein
MLFVLITKQNVVFFFSAPIFDLPGCQGPRRVRETETSHRNRNRKTIFCSLGNKNIAFCPKMAKKLFISCKMFHHPKIQT